MLSPRRITAIAKVGVDLAVFGVCFCLAFFARFEGSWPAPFTEVMLLFLPFVVVGKRVLLAVAGRLRSTWRYTGLRDALFILSSLGLAAVALLLWRVAADAGTPGLDLHRDNPLPVGVVLLDLALSFLGL